MSDKPPLLFLCHRIPYPPNKGDKIRSWHLLDHLADRFNVHLATFVDDPADHRYEALVRARCAGALFVPLSPLRAKLWSLRGLLAGEALSLAYYRSATMQRWVDATVTREAIERALVFCSPMAQYLAGGTRAGSQVNTVIVDLVDVDSMKWRQYAADLSGPMAWLYAREARMLRIAETAAAERASTTFLVSAREAALFREQAPSVASGVRHFSNGVASDYFMPHINRENPFAGNEQPLVFTGAMDYRPNIDAVTWFAKRVLPAIRARHRDIVFYVVGSKPAAPVLALADEPGIVVTGRVPDVRPYLQHALAAVAPLRIARGIQNKVLEAMAMAKPVLASSMGLEGIEAEHGDTVLRCDDVASYGAAVEQLLAGAHGTMGERARIFVEEHFNWSKNLAPVERALR